MGNEAVIHMLDEFRPFARIEVNRIAATGTARRCDGAGFELEAGRQQIGQHGFDATVTVRKNFDLSATRLPASSSPPARYVGSDWSCRISRP